MQVKIDLRACSSKRTELCIHQYCQTEVMSDETRKWYCTWGCNVPKRLQGTMGYEGHHSGGLQII